MVGRRKGTKWRASLTRLRSLLEAVYRQSLAHPFDFSKLKKGIVGAEILEQPCPGFHVSLMYFAVTA